MTVVGPMHLNFQTGFYEEIVRISNPTASTFDAVAALVSVMPTGWRLQNATFVTNGMPGILRNQPLPPGTNTDLTLKFYLGPTAHTNDVPTLVAVGMSPQASITQAGTPLAISRCLPLQDGSVLISFNTVSNATYYVQYSPDMMSWQTSPMAVQGNGNSMQWIDYGPPATESFPIRTSAKRYYRVVRTH